MGINKFKKLFMHGLSHISAPEKFIALEGSTVKAL